jgi:hypothetical protein
MAGSPQKSILVKPRRSGKGRINLNPTKVSLQKDVPSPLAGEGKGEGYVIKHPHLYPLPSRERRPLAVIAHSSLYSLVLPLAKMY